MSFFSNAVGVDAQRRGPRACVGQRRLRRLLHHLAQLPGQDQPPAPGHRRRLDEQHVAAGHRRSEARRDADFVLLGGQFPALPARPEELRNVLFVDRDRLTCRRKRHAAPRARQTLPSSRLQVADAGLARVGADDLADGALVHTQDAVRNPVLAQLPRQQIALADLQLLVLRVAGKFDDLHPVAERPGDRVDDVRRRHEEHARQIERHVEVVVSEASRSALGRAPPATLRPGRRGNRCRACRPRPA